MSKSIRLVTYKEMEAEKKENISYWLSKTPAERIDAFNQFMIMCFELQGYKPEELKIKRKIFLTQDGISKSNK